MGFDPNTGAYVDDDDPGTTLFSNSLRGFGAAPATAMRGPQPKFPWGGGASPAVPMRGPHPDFPYPDPNNFNPVQPANAPTGDPNAWYNRPSGAGFQPGQVDSGPIVPGSGGYGGAAIPPQQMGMPWAGNNRGLPVNPPLPPTQGGPAAAGGPTASAGGGGAGWQWPDFSGIGHRLYNALPSVGSVGQQIADQGAIEGGNSAVALPVKSGQNPAPTLPQPNYHMPWPRAQVPPQAGGGAGRAPQGGGGAAPSRGGGGAPQGGGGASSYGSPWDPQGTGYAAAQRLVQQQQQGSPWDPQGAGYAASQRLAQRAPVQGPLAALGQQPNSPFTMVLRPNAPAEGGGRGQGGSPLSTALDLSGYQPPPPPAPSSYNLGYGGGGRGGGRGGAPAPSRMRAQAPQDPGSAFWSTSGPGVGLPANKGPGFWAIHGPGVGLPANNGPGFWAIHGPGVGMPSPGPVNQPGFWGVHGRGVGFSGNQ